MENKCDLSKREIYENLSNLSLGNAAFPRGAEKTRRKKNVLEIHLFISTFNVHYLTYPFELLWFNQNCFSNSTFQLPSTRINLPGGFHTRPPWPSPRQLPTLRRRIWEAPPNHSIKNQSPNPERWEMSFRIEHQPAERSRRRSHSRILLLEGTSPRITQAKSVINPNWDN